MLCKVKRECLQEIQSVNLTQSIFSKHEIIYITMRLNDALTNIKKSKTFILLTHDIYYRNFYIVISDHLYHLYKILTHPQLHISFYNSHNEKNLNNT